MSTPYHPFNHLTPTGEMSPTATRTATSQIRLSPSKLNIVRGARDIPSGSLEAANRLLQQNHDEHHIFWRDFAGHNHTVHNVLTSLALGATPAELQSGFEDNLPGQRPPPPVNEEVIRSFHDEGKFYESIGDQMHYTNYLMFFERLIEEQGWKNVVNKYCFSHSKVADAILTRMFDGAFHSIIHLGLGIEFEQASIIAEGLAQAAVHDHLGTDPFFLDAEKMANESEYEEHNLVDLLKEARANETIRSAARWDDIGVTKMKKGVLGRSLKEMTQLAAKFRVTPEHIDKRTAEMISCCAYMAGAGQREGKARMIDFFYMHDVTSSIFVTILNRQSWISTKDKARIVEWKCRLDLVWYVSCGSPELDARNISEYEGGPADGMDWDILYKAINATHDDGHVAKFVRALKNGEEVSRVFESDGKAFPVKGDMWLRLARMAYNATVNKKLEEKWIYFAGFDQPWGKVAALGA